MKIAVEGCAHGELDRIYEAIGLVEKNEGIKVDLLIICGDFQACRNNDDLASMATPAKYRKMNSFYKYYSGEALAPVLTIFVGGNHEASEHLFELFHGGWVAPRIFYMGAASVIQCNGIRIGGLSGIFKPHDFSTGHFERPPFNEKTMRSFYHIREYEVFQLRQLRSQLDVFVSHDWPNQITQYGDVDTLVRKKPFFREEIQKGELGSPPAQMLLEHLRPFYWFAAHLHTKFAAVVPWPNFDALRPAPVVTEQQNSEIIDIDEEQDAPPPPESGEEPSKSTCLMTKFLALDKCLPGRHFLQIVDIPSSSQDPKVCLSYDPEWLAILRSTYHLFPLERRGSQLPNIRSNECVPSSKNVDWVRKRLVEVNGSLEIPCNFEQSITPYDPNFRGKRGPRVCAPPNSQTQELLRLLRLPDLMFGFTEAEETHNGKSEQDTFGDMSSNAKTDDIVDASVSGMYDLSSDQGEHEVPQPTSSKSTDEEKSGGVKRSSSGSEKPQKSRPSLVLPSPKFS